MICSQIDRIIPNNTSPPLSQSIIIGISDYIPSSFKANKIITICLIGSKASIINHVLWNEFFTKTLLKEAYYHLLQANYKDDEHISAIFMKFNEKVYKVEEVNEWKSMLRLQMIKSNTESPCLQLQGFSNKGYIKKVIISISKYNVNHEPFNLILNTNSLEVIRQNNGSNEKGFSSMCSEKVLEQNNQNIVVGKQFAISYNANEGKNFSSKSSKKHTQESNISFNASTKRSNGNKENAKNDTSKLRKSKFKSKKEKQESINKEKVLKQSNSKSSLSKDFFSNREVVQRLSKLYQKEYKNEPTRPQPTNTTRQCVMSKIISSKEQQIIHLKSQLKKQQQQYDDLLFSQQKDHKSEVQLLTGNVKELLSTYQDNQHKYINQNIYLKERVKVMEETLGKNNERLEKNTSDLEEYLLRGRTQEQTIIKLNEIIKSLKLSQDENRSLFVQQKGKLVNDVKVYRQKAEEYKFKYDRIVDSMKSMLVQ